jgi:hypothetical protein
MFKHLFARIADAENTKVLLQLTNSDTLDLPLSSKVLDKLCGKQYQVLVLGAAGWT